MTGASDSTRSGFWECTCAADKRSSRDSGSAANWLRGRPEDAPGNEGVSVRRPGFAGAGRRRGSWQGCVPDRTDLLQAMPDAVTIKLYDNDSKYC